MFSWLLFAQNSWPDSSEYPVCCIKIAARENDRKVLMTVSAFKDRGDQKVLNAFFFLKIARNSWLHNLFRTGRPGRSFQKS